MEPKEALENAIKDVKKEWGWILRESKPIEKLQKAIEKGNIKKFKKFERKAARFERRINQSEQNVIGILNFLRQIFPTWNNTLSKVERDTKIYNKIILNGVSLRTGTIPKFIKQNDINQLKIEVDTVMNKGVLPLDALLKHLERELKKSLERYIVAQETELDKRTKNVLNTQPFLIIFHSVSERYLVDKILSLRNLPTNFLGRRLEYAFETDYFWLEHKGRISGFFGHAPFKLKLPKEDLTALEAKERLPKNVLLQMRSGEYKGWVNKLLGKLLRKGLLLPRFLLPKIRQSGIKLMIEIKSGKGPMEKALDELVRMIKENGLENQILFIGFFYKRKALAYLKQRLPRALTVELTVRCPKAPFIDIFDGQSFVPNRLIMTNIKTAAKNKKFFIGGGVKKPKKFYFLIENGARGGLIWKSPEKVLEWLSHPEYAKVTAKQESMAFQPV